MAHQKDAQMQSETLPCLNAEVWLDRNSHGHLWKLPDGAYARCMRTPDCKQCWYEELTISLLAESLCLYEERGLFEEQTRRIRSKIKMWPLNECFHLRIATSAAALGRTPPEEK